MSLMSELPVVNDTEGPVLADKVSPVRAVQYHVRVPGVLIDTVVVTL
jgi:hypothetical protein